MIRIIRLALAIALFLGGIVTGCQIEDWFDIDTCLDRGGAWDYGLETCRYQ
jgi:hypothetical protein